MSEHPATEIEKDNLEFVVSEQYKTDYLKNIKVLTSEQLIQIQGKETTKQVPSELMDFLQSNNNENKIIYSIKENKLGETSVIGEMALSDKNKLILVLETEFDKSDDYKKFLKKKDEGKLTPDEEVQGFFGNKKGTSIRAKNVIVTDEDNEKAVDVNTFFSDVTFRFAPGKEFDNSEYDDAQHATEKLFTIGNLTQTESPILAFMGKAHEMGHRAMEEQTDPKIYADLTALIERSTIVNLIGEDRTRFNELLSENEVGAWLHALIIKQGLENRGVKLDVENQKVVEFANQKLSTYENLFGGEKKIFAILDTQLQNLPVIV